MPVTALATTSPTLLDWAKTLDPDGSVANQINMLAQNNTILEDIPVIEGNLPTGNRSTVITGLPAVAWKLFNAGVLPSKATTAQIDHQCGQLHAWSKVDKGLAHLNGNVEAFRMSQAKPFFEAMRQTVATTIFYGTAATPESFVGLSAQYSSLGAGNGGNIIDAGGTDSADNASIWLVAWDSETITGIFPKGMPVGMNYEDLGLQTDENAAGVTGALNRVYLGHWEWHIGLAVKNWTYGVRIANIDVSNLLAATTPADIIDRMEQALMKLPNQTTGNRRFYMNRTMARFLRSQARADVSAGGGLTYENFDGQMILMFGGIPVRIEDALLNTEARVV